MKKPCKINHPHSRVIYGIGALLTLMLMLLLSGGVYAQNVRALATIKGTVFEKGNLDIPVEFATVQLLPDGMLTTTDIKGNFSFERVSPGRVEIIVQFLGMNPADTTFTVQEGANLQLRLEMEYSSFRLAEVQVVAQGNKAGQATSSTITRQAMDHLRTVSVADVMQLLPGAQISSTNLSQAQLINIRSIQELSTTGAIMYNSTNAMNSMGAAVIVDGAPLSNNANLQAINPYVSGDVATVGASSSTGPGINSGIDLRGLSVDNIESIEIIRGVASAAYGDLTSGAVILRSKAGREPLKINFKTDPKIYSATLSKGMSLGEKTGNLNLSADYTRGVNSITQSYLFYERSTAKALYSNVFGKLYSNTSFDLNYNKDTRKLNPDDERTRHISSGKSLGLRLNTNGSFNNLEFGWLNNIKYTLSGSYSDKKSHDESLLGNAMAGYSTNFTDGAIISNRPGQKVYDVNGNELTNIPAAEMSSFFTVLPNEYFSAYDVYGKEINVFANITANLNKKINNIYNRISVGLDFKMDGNLGKGTVYEINNPPQRYGGNTSPRPRKFSDIPFIKQYSAFIEENMTWELGKRELNLQAGLRYDRFNNKDILAPRINVGLSIIPKALFIRAAYGIQAKAPTALYLYPDKAYFDFVHYNSLDRVGVPVEEQALLGSTRVFDIENPDLKIASTKTYEVGVDLKINKMRFSVTAYDRSLQNGYALGYDLDCYKLIPYIQYEIGENRPGQIPLLQEQATYNIFVRHPKPMNTAKSSDRGIEYDFNLGRFNAIRTAFVISGAYMRTTFWNDGYSYSNRPNGNELERNVGVYEKGVEKRDYERFNTIIRATHNIPQIGFVVTLATQFTWINADWYSYGNDTMFEKYISRLDGKVYDFNPAMKDDPEFRYLFEDRAPTRGIKQTPFPTVIFNLTLTKEISNILRASFNVHNMFNSRPLYESKKAPGSFTQLNIPIYFGFELGITL